MSAEPKSWRIAGELRDASARLDDVIARLEAAAREEGYGARETFVVVRKALCPNKRPHSEGRANGCRHVLAWTGERLTWDGQALLNQPPEIRALAAHHVARVLR
jgi:hypothetical protein